MERTFPVWEKEQRLIKANVRDIRYLDISLGVLMVVMGGKYTEVRGNNYGLVSIILSFKNLKGVFQFNTEPTLKSN